MNTEIEFVYHLHVNDTLQQTKSENSILSQSVQWMDKLVLYTPIFSKRSPPNSKQRSQCLIILMLIINVLFNLYFCGYTYYWTWLTLKNNWSETYVYGLIYIFGFACYFVGRFFNIYYFYKEFNFPWHYQSIQLENYKKIAQFVSCHNKIMMITLVCGIAADVIPTSYYMYYDIKHDTNKPETISAISGITGRLLVMYPLVITISVAGIIFIKYAIHIDQLTQIINSVNPLTDNSVTSVKSLMSDYRRLFETYNHDYCSSLKWSVQLVLLSAIVAIWVYTYEIFMNMDEIWGNTCEILADILMFSLFIIPASALSERYNNFEKSLWKIESSKKYMDNNNIEQKLEYNYLLQFVVRHPINVTITNFVITRKNTVNLFIGFLLLKLMSYSIAYFLY